MGKSSKSISDSLKEYGRGLTGGLLFSLPMLYTMELWWAGFNTDPFPLTVYFLVGLFLLMVYNYYVGIRHEHTIWEGLMESAEEMGLGLILTLFILWVTQRITDQMSIQEITGKIVVEAVTVAIGISVGKSQLGRDEEAEIKEEEKDEDKKMLVKSNAEPNLLRTLNISLCGAILIASNIAPTDEVIVIALETPAYKLFLIALLSIGIGGAVLYYINFTGSSRWVSKPSSLVGVFSGTLIMYAVSLVASAFMLWFFGRFENISLYTMVSEIVVLGFPAALGASAGRLLIQS
ncbi:TIGR02587 family membrane protein [Aequorivita sp. H23M31]|uniref:TIGR02587 family membrane protein n=1 Tax=Aequorivita ciconiae TaxID=2494375 RepID=A0A451FSA1_9FLAO|nr:TIGR02587 family membrane protein [Aequorivita sp. H23M31]QAA80264.1 TIGR02587 family membrane protein [Aequorivita sp. H23M31]